MNNSTTWKTCLILIVVWSFGSTSGAQPPESYLPVYGGPTYSPESGGYFDARADDVNDAGTAIGWARRRPNGTPGTAGYRAIRWSATDPPAELAYFDPKPSDPFAEFNYRAKAINSAGAAVGSAPLFSETGFDLGHHAARWEADSTIPMELESLGTSAFGETSSTATAVNDDGVAVGHAQKYDASGNFLGTSPARWDAEGAVSELDDFGNGGIVFAVNNSGVSVGTAYASSAIPQGRPIRWDASGTGFTELNGLGTYPTADNVPYIGEGRDINDAGTIVGGVDKYDASGNYMGTRAVRWESGRTEATELAGLETTASGVSDSFAFGINAAGTVLGEAALYDPLGERLGFRAVRWGAGSTEPTELAVLEPDVPGFVWSSPADMNDADVAVGRVFVATNQGDIFSRAVYWDHDGNAVDLNSLIDPESGWLLESAAAISNTGWIAGAGIFEPDGPEFQYRRLFLMHVPVTAAVPEPAAIVTLSIGAICVGLMCRRTKRRPLR